MKQVWQCGFCSEVNIEKESMTEHENKCHLNPLNKECFTCIHTKDEWWEGECNTKCTKGFDIYSDSDTCNSWIIKPISEK